jgi:hypothetical protein
VTTKRYPGIAECASDKVAGGCVGGWLVADAGFLGALAEGDVANVALAVAFARGLVSPSTSSAKDASHPSARQVREKRGPPFGRSALWKLLLRLAIGGNFPHRRR